MKTPLLAALLVTSSTAFAEDYWCLNRRIKIQIDYAYLRRQDVRDLRLVEEVPFFQELNKFKGKEKLETEDLEKRLNWESGIRGGLTFYADECSSIELLYTYVYPWRATSIVVPSPGTLLRFPFKDLTHNQDYHNANKVKARYTTWYQQGEINYWRHVTPQRCDYFSFSWNIGMRLGLVREKFNMAFTRGASVSDYKIVTKNVLFGPQLGAMLEINPYSCITWTFMLKGAGLANIAENNVDIRDDNNTVQLREYRKTRWTDSWLVDCYGQLSYHFTRSTSVHVGYQGLFLWNLAIAPNQRDVSVHSHRKINDEGRATIDGIYAGLDFNF